MDLPLLKDLITESSKGASVRGLERKIHICVKGIERLLCNGRQG